MIPMINLMGSNMNLMGSNMFETVKVSDLNQCLLGVLLVPIYFVFP